MKTNHNNVLYVLMLSILLFSCKKDDDGGTTTGFFPKEIIFSTPLSDEEETVVYEYNEKNQIISIVLSETNGTTFEYNDNDQISTINAINTTESFSVEYNGDIVSRIIDNTTNDVFEVSYTDGVYEFDFGTLTFDANNALTSNGADMSITYTEDLGPFHLVDYQPVVFFLGGASLSRMSYFFATHEVYTFTIPLGGQLTCETTRNSDNNISQVSVKNTDNDEVYSYVITYEQRTITN